MSATDLANYMQERMKTLNLSTISAAERSGISRQTWHKLRQADIKEAKLSTLTRVANTLQTTPQQLLSVYFRVGEIPCGTHNAYPASTPVYQDSRLH
jgi:DNA-binding Xre family transcriptional regulator